MLITKGMTGDEVIVAAQKERAKLGPGVNESIPRTIRTPFGLTKAKKRKDSEIAKELIYLLDVLHRPDLMLSAFYENRHRLSPQRYWDFLRTAWIAAGTVESVPLFREMFAAKKPWKQFLMSPEEEAELAALPESFTIWRAPRPGSVLTPDEASKRGVVEAAMNETPQTPRIHDRAMSENEEEVVLDDGGISWSISPVFVTEYAKKNGRQVVHKTVWKSYVTAYFNRRGEGEIILL